MIRRILRWLAGALVLAALAAYAAINLAPDDPARWHRDPAKIALRGTPNEFLAAVPGTTAALPHSLAVIHPSDPRALLACFDAIARSAPRVAVLAGGVDDLMITYVQRSRMIGFPDYVTVKAVAQETGMPGDGAGLIVWSRSRYGHADFGVNRARVEEWMTESGARCQAD